MSWVAVYTLHMARATCETPSNQGVEYDINPVFNEVFLYFYTISFFSGKSRVPSGLTPKTMSISYNIEDVRPSFLSCCILLQCLICEKNMNSY